jgi:uncharacterized OsmC-like protein
MAQAKDAVTEGALGRIVAKPIGENAILATIGVRPGSGGPWSYVIDVPAADGPLIAPPPHYYALTGWGACTAVTVTGVAHRGKIPLEGLDIDFRLERVSTPGSAGFGIHKKLILKGTLSETEVVRLRRAANFCPVDQLFTKGALEMEEHIEWASGDTDTLTLTATDAAPLENAPPDVVAGEVRCTHLVDTKVYADDGALFEGEVKSYLSCDDSTRQGHWVAVSGHSFGKWVPAPVPLTLAGLAASTAATLRRALVERGIASEGMSVEVGTIGTSDRGRAQANADAGNVRERKAIRRIKVPGDPSSVPLDVVRAALIDDPLTRAVRSGGVILSEDVEVI